MGWTVVSCPFTTSVKIPRKYFNMIEIWRPALLESTDGLPLATKISFIGCGLASAIPARRAK